MNKILKPPFLNPPLLGANDDPLFEATAGVTGVGGVNPGVRGDSDHNDGVQGSTEANGKHGVVGRNQSNGARGLLGGSDPIFNQHAGVYGESDQQGVIGLSTSDTGTGVYGGNNFKDGHGIGIRGDTSNGVGVQGTSFSEGAGIEGRSHSSNQGLAGRFIGNVHVQGNPGTSSGDLRVEGTTSLGGLTTLDGDAKVNGNVDIRGDLNMSSTGDIVLGDLAEGFSTEGEIIEPGTVVVLNQLGLVRASDEAYDKRVAGVVSGAGDYRPAIVLDKQRWQTSRSPIALVGKVCCKVDAQYSPIEIGDLLTTSPTLGHAMKAADPLKAFGSVIGKALRPLAAGQALIPILIALQ